MHGAPKCGKSFAIMDLAITIASGEPEWLGFPVATTGPVLYLQLDTPRGEWQSRLSAMQEAGRDLNNLIIVDRTIAPGFNIFNDAHSAWLQAMVAHFTPVVVVVDTLRRSYQGEERKDDIATLAMAAFEKAAMGTAIILVHHSRKTNPNPNVAKEDREDPMENMRGSSAWTGQMDTVMFLNGSRLIYRGRSIEDGEVKLRREANLLWAKDEDAAEAFLRTLPAEVADREAARALQTTCPTLSFSAAHMKVRRFRGRVK